MFHFMVNDSLYNCERFNIWFPNARERKRGGIEVTNNELINLFRGTRSKFGMEVCSIGLDRFATTGESIDVC